MTVREGRKQLDWSERITSHALETLQIAKYNKPKLVPTVQEVTTFHKFLDSKLVLILKGKNNSTLKIIEN